MSFITKNPLAAPIADNTPSLPPHGMRGLFPKSDGWYEIDSEGNVVKIGTGDGSLNPIIDLEVSSPIAPSNYEINIPELDELMTEGIYRLHHEDATIIPTIHTYAYCIVSYWALPPRANQTLLTEDGIYERRGNIAGWTPWTKLATQEELDKKLDAGTETDYITKVEFHTRREEEENVVCEELYVFDKNGSDRQICSFGLDLVPKAGSEHHITSGAVYDAVQEVSAIAKGRATGYVFDTKEDMDFWLTDKKNTTKLNLGDNFYIRDTNVPDYWWDGTAAQQLETQKVDLTEYVVKDEVIPVPTNAEVGQTIVVKEVDESGKPIEWETADVGGGATDEKWELLQSKDITEEDGEIQGLNITFPDGYKEYIVAFERTVPTSSSNTIIYPTPLNINNNKCNFTVAFWDCYDGTNASHYELKFSSMSTGEHTALKLEGYTYVSGQRPNKGYPQTMKTSGWCEKGEKGDVFKRWHSVNITSKLNVGSKYRVWGCK